LSSDDSIKRRSAGLVRGLALGGLTFVLSIFFTIPSQQAVQELSLVLAFPVLFLIISAAVVSDVIGVAAAAAEEAPFHSMSAKRLPGARQAIAIVRNSDRVNSFCADLIGDLAGTLGGAAGVAIVFRLLAGHATWNSALLSTIMLGGVAALMVGGKAAAKGFALHNANHIVLSVGKVLYYIERVLHIQLLQNGNKRRPRRRKNR